MSSFVGSTLLTVYWSALALLAAFGLHRVHLLALYLRHRHEAPRPAARFVELPRLTVQLPIYNEYYVAERLIAAVAALDYPRDRLEIQVLDDSTDETSARVASAVLRHRRAGLDITHRRRASRVGFKAGALAKGLTDARGELIAIFDADFVPRPDFARRLVDHFTDERVGMVQARWGHLNADYSMLTRVQAILLDGHFVIEQTARNRAGRFFNFNGTAGIWRRSCIEDAGGWQHDTLTEDLDLSYRAQLRGWRFVFLRDDLAPAELPVEMAAFKCQQHRWAKGSVQTARKLLPGILRGPAPLAVKLEAAVHLLANAGYVLLLLIAGLLVPVIWTQRELHPAGHLPIDLALFLLSLLSLLTFYTVAQREAGGRWWRVPLCLPALICVGIGLAVSNGCAVVEALVGHRSEFLRTPKLNLAPGEQRSTRRYSSSVAVGTWGEAALAVFFGVALTAAATSGLVLALPILALFGAGFGHSVALTLWQARARRSGSVS